MQKIPETFIRDLILIVILLGLITLTVRQSFASIPPIFCTGKPKPPPKEYREAQCHNGVMIVECVEYQPNRWAWVWYCLFKK